MKRKISLLLLLMIISLSLCTLTACQDDNFCIIDGDVAGNMVSVSLGKIKQEKYTYEDDGKEVKTKGWNLKTVLEKVEMLYDDNYLMITATDGVSVLIEAKLTDSVYLYRNDEGKLCSKGPNYPRAVGIKDISEITVITKNTDNITEGIKILSPSRTEYVSRGNAKLKLYKLSAANKMGDNSADKYLLSDDLSVSGFTGRDDNIVYSADYDMKRVTDGKNLSWRWGSLYCETDGEKLDVFGFGAGTRTILDSYNDIKTALDSGEKVMFILPDGFSWEQANTFADSLDLFKPSRAVGSALSTHTSISPVALAAIVTGQSPLKNGVHFGPDEQRRVLGLQVSDIFEYAKSINKTVSYIEGDGNLILTSVTPAYNSNGDNQIYETAKTAIAANTDLIFVHFHEIDDTNHKYGPLADESLNKLLTIESYVSDLKNQFDGTVIVVPDHGHNTLTDGDGKPYGKHGLFTHYDMYVPYYVFSA